MKASAYRVKLHFSLHRHLLLDVTVRYVVDYDCADLVRRRRQVVVSCLRIEAALQLASKGSQLGKRPVMENG